jgi:hypothetical protein
VDLRLPRFHRSLPQVEQWLDKSPLLPTGADEEEIIIRNLLTTQMMIETRTQKANGREIKDTFNPGEQYLPEQDLAGPNLPVDMIGSIDLRLSVRTIQTGDLEIIGTEGRRTGGLRRTTAGMLKVVTRTIDVGERTKKFFGMMIGEVFMAEEEEVEGSRMNHIGTGRINFTEELGTNQTLKENLFTERIF